MSAIGLLYVGAVLFVNGIMLMGHLDAKGAAPINLFVGLLQVVAPTYLIFTANGDASTLLNASGLYLFGFTYLYVAFLLFFGLDGGGFGYYCLFVAIASVGYSLANFIKFADPVFGVIWLYWALLWSLFFLVFGREKARLTRYTGIVALIQGWVTCAIPAALLLLGLWGRSAAVLTIVYICFAVVVFGSLYARERRTVATVRPSEEARTAAAAP
ncbi:AmiS/UreI family transporter [Pseudonocardia dioxanivorans]|uniref:AmiS/UreI family transporter n=1 Tax=Pseudonocardia dioxanivorans TaxID=240495 RepID=UPI000CD25649|nr:AmiS/UreI family transporter [Pseudonocardia dioxanivorans]